VTERNAHALNIAKPAGPLGEAHETTPWRVICEQHGPICLTEAEYVRQLEKRSDAWRCPHAVTEGDELGPCGAPATFDDDHFEEHDTARH
jgi:hypothetical protein